MKNLLLTACLWAISAWAWAQSGTMPLTVDVLDRGVPKKANREFQFIALYYNQLVNSNLAVETPFFQGQVIGRLFGSNTTNTTKSRSTYLEQRFLPFLIYQPKLMNGRVTLRASFEIDWTWGDASYGAAGNQGSAIGADQVNLQTQNIQAEFLPGRRWTINMGLQRMFDNHNNPYRVLFDELTSTGYRLMFWGTDGVGIQVRKDYDFSRFGFQYYQLYENNIQDSDDVVLYMANYEKDLTKKWSQGLSVWYVQDRARGQGGSIGNGLNSALVDLNGGYRFPLGSSNYTADVLWVGTTTNYNANFSRGRHMLTGFLNANFGQVNVRGREDVSIAGLAANLRLGYKYGQTNEDALYADLIYTSGDDGIDDNRFSGVMTGNTWGTPASLYINHGAYLLFPHGNVVNRFVAAVNDISNAGYGLTGGTVNLHRDFIPNKFSGKVGGAYALSQVAPQGGGKHIGTEINARLRYTPKVFMDLELHAAYLNLGNFYDSQAVNGGAAARPNDYWTIFLVYRWLMF